MKNKYKNNMRALFISYVGVIATLLYVYLMK